MNNSGTPEARLTYLLEELGRRFPEAEQPYRSDPPEVRFLAAIDTLLDEKSKIK